MRFIDLFAGIGGFHRALANLGHSCVFASELDEELRRLYVVNFPEMRDRIFGDIRSDEVKAQIPAHEILCAGFPCQPFSKSGSQRGTKDETRGTLFHEILAILKEKKPRYLLLENVGNFGRHDEGRTWQIVRDRLEKLGYDVRGTEHLTPQSRTDWRDVGSLLGKKIKRAMDDEWEEGHGLISPHHFGYPHHRERFFIVGALDGLPEYPFPQINRGATTTLSKVVLKRSKLREFERHETSLSKQQRGCIRHWNKLIRALPRRIELPSFPIWGDELGARYPFVTKTPWGTRPDELRKKLPGRFAAGTSRKRLFEALPSYAREPKKRFRYWKIRYIWQNRDWWKRVRPHMPHGWAKKLKQFPPSLRKLEWNVKGGERNLWKYVLQFRPSGLRVKKYVSSPALVAMTSTQIPVLGPEKRFLTRREGLRLQGFSARHKLPESRDRAFQALGNAVHVGVVERIAGHLLQRHADVTTKRNPVAEPQL